MHCHVHPLMFGQKELCRSVCRYHLSVWHSSRVHSSPVGWSSYSVNKHVSPATLDKAARGRVKWDCLAENAPDISDCISICEASLLHPTLPSHQSTKQKICFVGRSTFRLTSCPLSPFSIAIHFCCMACLKPISAILPSELCRKCGRAISDRGSQAIIESDASSSALVHFMSV